ncbi:hypothetical protein F4778DRAFT_190734 [Xylariomycetidae sp. FL2044]|nr:hypothetical protein F4778DRAFT_190734 [Xylariomycetidae sp. FL2044]
MEDFDLNTLDMATPDPLLDLDFGTLHSTDGDCLLLGRPSQPVLDIAEQEPSDDANPSHAENELSSSQPRAYHAKRPHRKSRAGCTQCKRRKVKCDEVRPTCKACKLRKETCVYPSASPPAPRPASTRRSFVHHEQSPAPSSPGFGDGILVEPLYRPAQMSDTLDMKMLWFYTTASYESLSIESSRSDVVDKVLKVTLVEHAFRSPFLLDTLMAFSSLHLQSLNEKIPASRAMAYQARAFEGYRNAVQSARRADFPALLACSLIMCALSTQMFRESHPGLYIIDWITVWRGIGMVVDIITPQAVADSGLAVLFYRPPIDFEKTTKYIPNNLLFMVSSIRPGDADLEHQKVYYDFLRFLGGLYMELKEHGFSSILDLRIVTFFTFTPKPFVPLAREGRPRALIILAYYLCFIKLTQGIWWMADVPNREISKIIDMLGHEWEHLLHVPRMILATEDKTEIARFLAENHSWTPAQVSLHERQKQLLGELGHYTNDGTQVTLENGHWRIKTRQITWDKTKLGDASLQVNTSEKEMLALKLVAATPHSASSRTSDNSSTPSTVSTGKSPSP